MDIPEHVGNILVLSKTYKIHIKIFYKLLPNRPTPLRRRHRNGFLFPLSVMESFKLCCVFICVSKNGKDLSEMLNVVFFYEDVPIIFADVSVKCLSVG